MRFLALFVIVAIVGSCLAIEDVKSREQGRERQLTKEEVEEITTMKKRLDSDPEFRAKVESELEESVRSLPVEEQKAIKKRFWGLWGLPLLTLLNPFLMLGKRSINEEVNKVVDLNDRMIEKKSNVEGILSSPVNNAAEITSENRGASKRFWGLWGLGYPFGLGFGFPFFGKKRVMESNEHSNVDEPTAIVDRELLEKRDREYARFEEAEKRLAPELYKKEGELISVEEVKELKKRWWGLGYGYGLGLGYGWGLGYPWGFYGKRDVAFNQDKRDSFIDAEMTKKKREEAYERFLTDL